MKQLRSNLLKRIALDFCQTALYKTESKNNNVCFDIQCDVAQSLGLSFRRPDPLLFPRWKIIF